MPAVRRLAVEECVDLRVDRLPVEPREVVLGHVEAGVGERLADGVDVPPGAAGEVREAVPGDVERELRGVGVPAFATLLAICLRYLFTEGVLAADRVDQLRRGRDVVAVEDREELVVAAPSEPSSRSRYARRCPRPERRAGASAASPSCSSCRRAGTRPHRRRLYRDVGALHLRHVAEPHARRVEREEEVVADAGDERGTGPPPPRSSVSMAWTCSSVSFGRSAFDAFIGLNWKNGFFSCARWPSRIAFFRRVRITRKFEFTVEALFPCFSTRWVS